MNSYPKLKVRFFGSENDDREIIVEGPLDGSLHWFEVIQKIYLHYEIISRG